ncbi:MAG TPA: hypothetical protein VE572_02280 [Nitrososphaeraceae archaeon]|nr:hypothetical protein [Nitrososphaeraceae archaeon]
MTGIRKGAIPDLRVGSLAKITKYRDKDGRQHTFESHYIYKLTVYEGSDSEYVILVHLHEHQFIDNSSTYLLLTKLYMVEISACSGIFLTN